MRRLAAEHLLADDALGVLDRDLSLPALEEDDDADDQDDEQADDGQVEGRDVARPAPSENMRTTASGMSATMPAKMMSEMPLPMPRSVICSPSHMMKAVPVVSEIIVSSGSPSPD